MICKQCSHWEFFRCILKDHTMTDRYWSTWLLTLATSSEKVAYCITNYVILDQLLPHLYYLWLTLHTESDKMFSVDAHERQISKALIRHHMSDLGLHNLSRINRMISKLLTLSAPYSLHAKIAKIHRYHSKVCWCILLNVKQFGSQMRSHVLWGLIWIQTVWKGHQQYSKFTASRLRIKVH